MMGKHELSANFVERFNEELKKYSPSAAEWGERFERLARAEVKNEKTRVDAVINREKIE